MASWKKMIGIQGFLNPENWLNRNLMNINYRRTSEIAYNTVVKSLAVQGCVLTIPFVLKVFFII